MSSQSNHDAELEDEAELSNLAQQVLDTAKRLGADAAETSVSRSNGLSATVRMGEVETIEHNRDKSLALTVYFANKSGSASTSDFNESAVEDSVRAACSIAKFTAADECSGLADADRLATVFKDLKLNHPWDLSVTDAIELAKQCEDSARNYDSKITNSEGASVNSHGGCEAYANSHGFSATTTGTRHGISCAVLGEQEGAMQRDYWWGAARDRLDMESPQEVGETAAKRTIRRLGARKIGTRQCPVIYEAPIAASLLSHFIGAIRGGALYRKTSFLLDTLGKSVFSDWVRVHEQPHMIKGMGSSAYDSEGVATQSRDIVRDGVLQGYVLSSYSARKLGMETTGNAGGVRNLTIESGTRDLAGLLADMGSGILITELIGSGVNPVTGDYSRGAVGFWVQDGEIQHPVEEITVAGNLKDMFRGMVDVGTDTDTRGNIRSGSIMLEQVTVAGA